MDYFIGLIQKEFQRQEKLQKYLVDVEADRRIAEREGQKAAIDPQDMTQISGGILMTEAGLKTAMHDYLTYHEAKDEDLVNTIRSILSGYEQHSKLKIGAKPYYDNLTQEVRQRNGDISCVVDDGKRVFDPRLLEKWTQANYQEGTDITFYLHNLNGHEHRLTDFVTYIGPLVEEEKPVIEYHPDIKRLFKRENLDPEDVVKNERYGDAKKGFFAYVVPENELGIHGRPAALIVEAANRFDCDVLVYNGKYRTSGKSIMGIMTLDPEKGNPKGTNMFLSVVPYAGSRDAEECIDGLIELFKTKFNED